MFPSQIWLAVSSRFDKGGGIGAPRRDWSASMRRKERGGRQTCVSAKHLEEEEGRSHRERERERDTVREGEKQKKKLVRERGEIPTCTYRGRKKDRWEPV